MGKDLESDSVQPFGEILEAKGMEGDVGPSEARSVSVGADHGDLGSVIGVPVIGPMPGVDGYGRLPAAEVGRMGNLKQRSLTP